jgi:hypothetical protein
MGIAADVALLLVVSDSQITAVPFRPITAAKELEGRIGAPWVAETFLYALPSGTLARLNGAKVRLQGPQRTCDGQLDERAQHALAALLEKGN